MNSPIILICRDCHDLLEEIINEYEELYNPEKNPLSKQECEKLSFQFINPKWRSYIDEYKIKGR